MKHDIEKDLRFFESEDGLKKDKMSRAADGQELGQPLNKPKEDGLKNMNLSPPSFNTESWRSPRTEDEPLFLNVSEKRQWWIEPSLQPVS